MPHFHFQITSHFRTANWPHSYRRRLRFSMHDVWYPEVGFLEFLFMRSRGRFPQKKFRGRFIKSVFMRDHLFIIGVHHCNMLVKFQLKIIIKLLNPDTLTSILQDREDMRTMFRVCATERLFVPDMFPDMDRAIYIDTDLIFMRFLNILFPYSLNYQSSRNVRRCPKNALTLKMFIQLLLEFLPLPILKPSKNIDDTYDTFFCFPHPYLFSY